MPNQDFDKYAFKVYKWLGAGWILIVVILAYLVFKKDDNKIS